MFVPPPTPTLSKAEIKALRARIQSESKASSNVDPVPNTVSTGGSGEHRSLVTELSSLESPTALIRRIGIFGLGKDEKKARPAIEISAPILLPPSAHPPAGPDIAFARLQQKSAHQDLIDPVETLPSPPLSLPNTTNKAAQSPEVGPGSDIVTLTSEFQSPRAPPRRPPRPPSDLSLEAALISPSLHQPPRASTEHHSHGCDRTSMSKHSRETSAASQLSFLAQRTSSDRSIHSEASSASSQAFRPGVQSGRIDKNESRRGNSLTTTIDEESNALRDLIKVKRFKRSSGKTNHAARHQRTSSLEAALLGLGVAPVQPKRAVPTLSIHAVPYIPRSHGLVDAALYQQKALPDIPHSTPRTQHELSGFNGRAGLQVEHALVPSKTVLNRKARTNRHSSGRLSAIPEHISGSKKSRPNSDVSTPIGTHIHLRGGSVVTVTRPELEAWKRTVYLHGPIRLSKPAIIPRKNSIASLEPFQEAVDLVYQDALRSSRRQSDEAATKEICKFFVDFGTCDIYSPPCSDMMSSEGVGLSDEDEDADCDVFLNVPDSPEVSPSIPLPALNLPPVETEEILRARGIARMMKGRETSKAELARTAGSALTLVPLPEESILDAVLASAVKYDSRDKLAQNGVDSSAPWIRSGNKHKAAALKRYSQ